MSILSWFFGTNTNRAQLGEPGAQGMVVLNRTPPKTTDQVRAEQEDLPPRQWSIYQGDGRRIGVATEDKTTKIVTVVWDGAAAPLESTSYVDEDAMTDDLYAGPEDNTRIRAYGFIHPIRVRFHPRNEQERWAEEMKASFF
jgi:hypothetical protein